MKPIKLKSYRTWQRILDKLHEQYPPSYFLRDKMRDKLGFTVREHTTWVENKNYAYEWRAYEQQIAQRDNKGIDCAPDRGHSQRETYLDFYNENKKTMFLLKFAEELAKDD
jgi:hypothetical protein